MVMFGLGRTKYGKKGFKDIVHFGDYYPHLLGPGEKDASLAQ